MSGAGQSAARRRNRSSNSAGDPQGWQTSSAIASRDNPTQLRTISDNPTQEAHRGRSQQSSDLGYDCERRLSQSYKM